MIRNYIFIFLRSLRKNKLHTIINVLGLAFGLASATMISLYIYDELSFNRIHPSADRTYRLGFGVEGSEGQSRVEPGAPGVILRRLKEEFPEAEQTLRVLNVTFPTTIANKEADKSTLTDDRRWVESAFAEVLALDIVKGNKDKIFEQPNSIVISETAAREMFGEADALGKTLTVIDREITQNKELGLMVTGVYKDYPANSTFRFKYLINLESARPFVREDWSTALDQAFFESYVVLREGADVVRFNKFLKFVCMDVRKTMGDDVKDVFVHAASLRELHFDSVATWDYTGTVGSKKYLGILSTIAVLILIIACINYMNLATAKATQRAKEIGIRKSFGSSRRKLALQFMMESAGIAIAALVIAIVMAQLFLSRFNALSGKHFTPADFFRSDIFLIMMIITLFTVIAGGSYPAFVLSRFKPVEVLKSKVSGVQGGQWFRRTLVTIQYAVAISLTIVAIVIVRQVDLMHKSKLNEKGEQVMMVRFGSVAKYRDFFSLKHDLLQDPTIESVSLGDAFPRLDHWGIARLDATIPEISNKPNAFNQLLVDFDFLKLFDVKLVAGRAFDPGNPADSLSVVLNESAVKSMNLTHDQVVGATMSIKMYGDDDPNGGRVDRTIIGVVKDFPYKNMRRVIEPLILNPNPNQKYFTSGTMMYVKLPQTDIQKKIQFVEATWKKNMPDVGLQYYFVNDLFGRLYKSELTIAALTLNFSVLSIIITVFGLFGLASFDAERKTKEIGVRKVHGASVWQITRLLLVSFVRIFLIAAVIVVPIDYYILNDWLTSFQYRTSLDLIVFGGSLGLLLLVTILTVSYETIKAAVANPIDSLRYE